MKKISYYKNILTKKNLKYIGIQKDEKNRPVYVLFNTVYNATISVNVLGFSINKVNEKVLYTDKKFKNEA